MKNELEPPIFSLTTFPPRRLSSKNLPLSVSMVSKFKQMSVFFFADIKKQMTSIECYFCVFLHFFRSVLVRNSAISSADSSEHCRLFVCSLKHTLGCRAAAWKLVCYFILSKREAKMFEYWPSSFFFFASLCTETTSVVYTHQTTFLVSFPKIYSKQYLDVRKSESCLLSLLYKQTVWPQCLGHSCSWWTAGWVATYPTAGFW